MWVFVSLELGLSFKKSFCVIHTHTHTPNANTNKYPCVSLVSLRKKEKIYSHVLVTSDFSARSPAGVIRCEPFRVVKKGSFKGLQI